MTFGVTSERFCKICGHENRQTQSGFNPDTGKPNIKYWACETDDCRHDHHKFNFWNKCKICGVDRYANIRIL